MPKRKIQEKKLYNPNLSAFTRVIFYMGIIAVGIMLVLGIRHINDPDPIDKQFAMLNLIEAIIGATGLFFIDIIRGHGFPPDKFQDFETKSITRALVIFMAVSVVQILFFIVPLTIRDYELALAIVFAAPCEELFFRGFFISIGVRIGHNDQNKISLPMKRKISLPTLITLPISAILFAALHINYWNDLSLMLTVFFGGLVLGLLYWWWRDLTAVILAHFLLNIIVVGQSLSFYLSIIIGGAILGFLLIFFIFSKRKKKKRHR